MSQKIAGSPPRGDKTRGSGSKARSPRSEAAEAVQIAVNEHCLLHYGTSYVGGKPYRLTLPNTDVWIVPALLTSPGYGIVGVAGMVVVDAMTGVVVSAASREEVRATGTRLAQEKRHELDAAFRRARKA
jgi:hypothetical protein